MEVYQSVYAFISSFILLTSEKMFGATEAALWSGVFGFEPRVSALHLPQHLDWLDPAPASCLANPPS